MALSLTYTQTHTHKLENKIYSQQSTISKYNSYMKTQVEKSKLKIILVNKLRSLRKLPFGAG